MSKLALGTRAASTFIRALQFAISALILGIFSYYLAVISRRAGNPAIPRWEKAVEGMSGIAVIYTAFAVVLTCFLGGITFFAFLAVLLDVAFCGAFIAIAVLARGGVHKCTGVNNSPIGPGNHVSCQLERVTFIVAIIGAFLFLISAALQVLLSRAHKREKRYGPGPSNNYTSGYGKQRFWQRKNNKNKSKKRDAELGAFSAGGLATEEQHHTSDGTAVGSASNGYGGPNTKYGEPTVPSVAHSADPYSRTSTGMVSSTNYEPQQTGVTGGNYSEMPAEHVGSTNRPNVQHDSKPYADIHQGGYVHNQPESGAYSRNV